jgi:hypothetical protein
MFLAECKKPVSTFENKLLLNELYSTQVRMLLSELIVKNYIVEQKFLIGLFFNS